MTLSIISTLSRLLSGFVMCRSVGFLKLSLALSFLLLLMVPEVGFCAAGAEDILFPDGSYLTPEDFHFLQGLSGAVMGGLFSALIIKFL